MKRKTITALWGVVLLIASGVANAGLVRATWDGEVQSANAGNAFGVVSGDTVSGYAVFDTSWLGLDAGSPPGFNTIVHNFDPVFQMGVSIGTRTFVESEDSGWEVAPFSLPTLYFQEISSLAALKTSWSGIFFNTCPDPVGGFPDCTLGTDLAYSFDPFNFVTGWTVYDNGSLVASGEWRFNSLTIQRLPIPSTLPLVFGGLIAMFGFARRRYS